MEVDYHPVNIKVTKDSNVEINDNDILRIITSLDPNKSHGMNYLFV